MSTIISDRSFNNPMYKIQMPDGKLPKGANVLAPMTYEAKMMQGRALREGPSMENVSSRRAELGDALTTKVSERMMRATQINNQQPDRVVPEYKFR
jgi:hypothetical protein